MARTPLLEFIRRQLRDHARADAQGVEVERLRDARAEASLRTPVSRRNVLTGAAAVTAGLATTALPRAARATGPVRIAIVGGGIAGLNTALTLRDGGYRATVYESSPVRAGGRIQSDRGEQSGAVRAPGDRWDDGQVTEVYGEFLDSDHVTMAALARRFNLGLVDALAAEPAGSTNTHRFFDRYYTPAEADRDFARVYRAVQNDLAAAGETAAWNESTAAGRALDAMSIWQWIETRIPGGHRAPLGALLDVAYVIEFGADTRDQSALNLLYLLGYSERRRFTEYGTSDERYRVRGGNDGVTRAIARYLGDDTFALGHTLTALVRRNDGTFTLRFQRADGGTRNVDADLVVLALPFSALRNVDLSRAGFDALKLRAIRELGMGRNGKLHLQFDLRYWNLAGPWGVGTGSGYSDTGVQAIWESTRGQPGNAGILVKFTGAAGSDALNLRTPYGGGSNPAVRADAETFLRQLEPMFPGVSARWNGRATSSLPHLDPRFNASYAYWRVGQVTRIGGYEGVRQGNVFFAGDHTSVEFQGYMEGGASEGARVGGEILQQLSTVR